MIYKEIWSASNETAKHVKKLQALRSYREECGAFVVEGERAVLDAIKAGAQISIVIASTEYIVNDFPQIEGATFFTTTEDLFSRLSETKSPQGIMAVAGMPKHDLNAIFTKPNPMVIICDGISDPGNMGTIIRTADAAGACGVLLSKGCVDPFNPKTVRSTMASLFNVPLVIGDRAVNYIEFAKASGVTVIAGDPYATSSLYEIDYTGAVAIIIGNEAHGISAEAMDMVDVKVNIPLIGKAESLNAAVAAAVFMYEAVRQRLGKIKN